MATKKLSYKLLINDETGKTEIVEGKNQTKVAHKSLEFKKLDGDFARVSMDGSDLGAIPYTVTGKGKINMDDTELDMKNFEMEQAKKMIVSVGGSTVKTGNI